MAFNRFMHPRNVYRTPPDFKELAVRFPEFRRHAVQDLCGILRVDFKNPDALRALTCALLKKDFDLDVEIPKDRLIPTVPLRLNYILWIEDLLSAVPACNGEKKTINGIDIGTGTSCIYPLLGARKNSWHFVATEADAEACDTARRNVSTNGLDDKVKVVQVATDSAPLEVVRQTGQSFDFSMCNPPFFLDELDAKPEGKGRSAFRPPPRGANSPSQHEAVTAGGEVALVRRIIEDSLVLKDAVRLYTTMLGKKQSLGEVKRLLHDLGGAAVASVAQTEFCQGHTMRWGIAWTFRPEIALDKVQRPREKTAKPLTFDLPAELGACSLEEVLEKIQEILKELKIAFAELKHDSSTVLLRCAAMENTWSNQRRKRRALERVAATNGDSGHQRSVEEDGFPEATKRPKTKETSEENGVLQRCDVDSEQSATAQGEEGPKAPAAVCLLTLHQAGGAAVLGLQWLEGALGRDAGQQILQYFRNRLK